MERDRNFDRSDECPALQDIRVTIIGSKTEYKCNAANTILGHNDCNERREIVESEIKQRMNHNRSVSVVLTPGWWKSFTLAESAKSLKMEIVHSLKLCPSPHAFLLVVNLHTTFTDTHLNSVIEHMEILGEQIWKHTIVLLVYDNKEQRNGDNTQLIKRAGRELDILIKKCGNRVHVFNYTVGRGRNVEQLFHQIERLVAEHEGQCFKIDDKLLDDMEEKRTMVKKRAEERAKQVKKSQTLKEHQTELRIVLMGRRIAGKTSVMNNILQIDQEVSKTNHCVLREGKLENIKVTVIDTPGWWPYASVKETPDSIKQEIISSVSMCPPGPHAVLLVLQSGVVFSKAYGKSIKEHMELLSRNVWKYCMVVFTRGDWMGTPTIEEHIESEGEDLQWLINKCGNRYHVLNNKQQDDRKQVRELMEKMEMMVRENKELLTPVEEETEESDSGWGSVMSDQDKLERGSLDLIPPLMRKKRIMEWLEDNESVSVFSNFPENHLEKHESHLFTLYPVDEAYFEKLKKDLDYISDHGTLEELTEQSEEKQRCFTPIATSCI